MEENSNFITSIVKKDIEDGVYEDIHTRFPPEPNGYLHIGNAYAINISYEIAKKFNGKLNLRFDDTNPAKEDMEYVDAIKDDFEWLGLNYEIFYGSDYSEQLYEYALYLIKKGKAYVDDLSPEEIKRYRGTLTTKGENSPYRNRSIDENLALFIKMKEGLFKEGEKVLRAKIDMASPNINLRDPIIYRISYKSHYRLGNKWCIYPLYDYAHPIQDYLENITHSLCSIEFRNHRPLYEWVLTELDFKKPIPKQVEFGRMNLSGVVTSKRYIRMLVESKLLDGWSDPRLPTLKGLRRRGYTKEALFNFLNEIGVGKSESLVDNAMLEHELRQDLITKVPAVMAVLNPLKVVITNLPDNYTEEVEAENNPKNEVLGKRKITFSKTVYIEREDFSENPPKKYKRLVQGEEVRLRHAYFIKCNEVIKDEEENVIELRCTYDPQTKSGSGFNERKPKGTLHWVSATESLPCNVRLFSDLFTEMPNGDNLFDVINKDSLVEKQAYVEKAVLDLGNRYQFIRHGFFIKDEILSSDAQLVFNHSVSLKSSFKKNK